MQSNNPDGLTDEDNAPVNLDFVDDVAENLVKAPITIKTGRPTKLTNRMIEHTARLFMIGASIATVCEFLVISKSTFYEWKEKGQEEDADKLYKDFLYACNRSTGVRKLKYIELLNSAIKRGETQHIWKMLGSLEPETYRENNKLQLTGDADEPVHFEIFERGFVE